MNANLGVIMKS